LTGTIDGVLDDDQHQRVENLAFTGSYSVASNGRSSMNLQLGANAPDNRDRLLRCKQPGVRDEDLGAATAELKAKLMREAWRPDYFHK
jgi:hypothetical protein